MSTGTETVNCKDNSCRMFVPCYDRLEKRRLHIGAATSDTYNITKTRLFKYIENFTSKTEDFQIKKNSYFSYFC